MNRTIDRLKLVFLGLFSIAAVAIGYYQLSYARPEQACTSKGRWWDARTRSCGTPVFIPVLTGRPPPPGVERPAPPPRRQTGW
jgi:hypothetical protein